MYKEGSNFKAKDGKAGTVISTNTDCKTVWQAAVTAAIAAGGGTVKLQGGSTYNPNGTITITGSNIGIECESGALVTPQAGTYDLFAVDGSYFRLDNMNCDMSAKSNGTGNFIRVGQSFASAYPIITRCKIKNPPTNGIYFDSGAAAGVISHNDVQSSFAPTGSGILIASGTDHFIFCNGSGGFGAQSAFAISGAGFNRVIGNEFYSSGRGISEYLGTMNIYTGNKVQASILRGFQLNDDIAGTRYGPTIVGNMITDSNFTGTSNVYSHVELLGSAGTRYGTIVNDNFLGDIQGTPKTKYGVFVNYSGYQNTSINGNTFFGNVSGDVQVSSAGAGLNCTYRKAIDANNDAIYRMIKLNAAFVEVKQ